MCDLESEVDQWTKWLHLIMHYLDKLCACTWSLLISPTCTFPLLSSLLCPLSSLSWVSSFPLLFPFSPFSLPPFPLLSFPPQPTLHAPLGFNQIDSPLMGGRADMVDGGMIGSMRHRRVQPTGLGRTDSSYFFDPIAGEVFWVINTVTLYLVLSLSAEGGDESGR